MENKKIKGELFFDKKILDSIVAAAVVETSGVFGLYKVSVEKFNKEKCGSSIIIEYSELGMHIAIKVVAYDNVFVNDLVYKIQQNVKNSISNMIDIPILAIDVTICNIVEYNKD